MLSTANLLVLTCFAWSSSPCVSTLADEVSAHAKEQTVNQMIDRVLPKSSLSRMDLDKTTFGKTRGPSIPVAPLCTRNEGQCSYPPCDCPKGDYLAFKTSSGDVCYSCGVAASSPSNFSASGPSPSLAVGLGFLVLVGAVVTLRKSIADHADRSSGPFEREQWSPVAMLYSLNTRRGYLPLCTVIKNNIVPSLTTALVAIPLSLALGIATGTSPMIGIATAVLGGLFSGAFGSSAFNIVGPAGALVGILARYSQTYGPEILPWLSLASAVMIWVAVKLRLQEYCLFMPKAVFEGFTMSVALTIGLGQMNFGLGLSPQPPVPVPGLDIAPNIYGLIASIKALNTMCWLTTELFLLSVVALLLMYRAKPNIPWIVPFAALTALFGFLSDPDTTLGMANGQFKMEVPTLKAKYGILQFQLATALKPLTEIITSAENGTFSDYVMGAFSVALVAVMETLISGKIAATRAQFSFDQEQELQGLALSHAACGLCGLMPPSGVFVRTSVNLSTGATYKISQFMQALWVLLLASICMPALSYLPQFAVAAILVVASIRMVPWRYIGQLLCEHKWYFGLLLIVALVCWIISSVAGLFLGTAVVLLVTGKEAAQGHAEISIVSGDMDRIAESMNRVQGGLKTDDASFIQAINPPGKVKAMLQDDWNKVASKQVYLYKILGQLDFLNGEKHVDRLRTLASTRPTAVVISLQNVGWTDPDGIQFLKSMVAMLEEAQVKAFVVSPRPKVTQALEKEFWHTKLRQKNRVFTSEHDVDVYTALEMSYDDAKYKHHPQWGA